MTDKSPTIAFQGVPGAYSEAATRALYPAARTLPCPTFEDAFGSVRTGDADLAMIPVENLIAGRVADVHALLPDSGLSIIGEHFQPIEHHLLALPGSHLADIKLVISHIQGLSQCRQFLAQHQIASEVFGDTAGAAEEVAKRGDKTLAAIASARAGEIYGLQSIAANIADHPQNMTRFLVLALEAITPPLDIPAMTSLIFTSRSVPAALYKALGGFATNGINLTKIESYVSDEDFTSAKFYIDVEAHRESAAMKNALEELAFFAPQIQILGTYPQAAWRRKI